MAKRKERRLDLRSDLGLTRRDLLRRGAVVGGTLLWAAPAVQSITQPAFAQEHNGSVRYACCWCTSGSKPGKAFCSTLGGGPGLGGDADCAEKCTSHGYANYEFHLSSEPFTCSGSAGCQS